MAYKVNVEDQAENWQPAKTPDQEITARIQKQLNENVPTESIDISSA